MAGIFDLITDVIIPTASAFKATGADDWALNRVKSEYKKTKRRSKRKSAKISNQIGGHRKVVKGRLDKLTFQVNPTTIAYGGGVNWTEVGVPERYAPLIQSGSPKTETVAFELYMDEWMFDHKINVQDSVDWIHTLRDSRQCVKLVLGNFVRWVVISDCQTSGESFNPNLSLREVKINMTLWVVK